MRLALEAQPAAIGAMIPMLLAAMRTLPIKPHHLVGGIGASATNAMMVTGLLRQLGALRRMLGDCTTRLAMFGSGLVRLRIETAAAQSNAVLRSQRMLHERCGVEDGAIGHRGYAPHTAYGQRQATATIEPVSAWYECGDCRIVIAMPS